MPQPLRDDLTAASPEPPIHPRLAALFGALDAAGVTWAVLRGEDELDGRPGDVDLLVAPGEGPALRRVARDAGFVRLPARGYGRHVFLIGYDEPTDRWLKLDVVDGLAFGRGFALSLDPAVTRACLNRRRWSGPVATLEPGDAFWALLLHVLLDRSGEPDERGDRLVALAPAGRAGGPLGEAIASRLPEGWSPAAVADAVERSAWADLRRLGSDLAAAWRRTDRQATMLRRLDALVGRRAGRVDRLRRPRGLSIVLVGPPELSGPLADAIRAVPLPVRVAGAGSSTLADRLRVRLRRAEGLVVIRSTSRADVSAGPLGRAGRRRPWAEALSSPAPDLVIVLEPAAGEATDDAEESRPSGGTEPGIQTIDATLPGERLRRAVGRLVWSRLADRWNAVDRSSTEP